MELKEILELIRKEQSFIAFLQYAKLRQNLPTIKYYIANDINLEFEDVRIFFEYSEDEFLPLFFDLNGLFCFFDDFIDININEFDEYNNFIVDSSVEKNYQKLLELEKTLNPLFTFYVFSDDDYFEIEYSKIVKQHLLEN